MNPRSGGGKVVRFDLQPRQRRWARGSTLLDGPGYVDVAALVREAVADGADLLGVAGGDGTQALVAGIAAEHDIPLLVISAGTRNHFALDLGLDRDDPSTCLAALTDGEEVRVDLGMIADRPFVNNASFGAYAEIVQSPEYRDNKNRTMLEMLPDLLSGERGPTSRSGPATPDRRAGGAGQQQPLRRRQAAGHGPPCADRPGRPGCDHRPPRQYGRGGQPAAPGRTSADHPAAGRHEVVIDSDTPTIPVGIDGEAVTVDTPVHCTIRPRALRVRLPRNRPGVAELRTKLDWKTLWRLGFGR